MASHHTTRLRVGSPCGTRHALTLHLLPRSLSLPRSLAPSLSLSLSLSPSLPLSDPLSLPLLLSLSPSRPLFSLAPCLPVSPSPSLPHSLACSFPLSSPLSLSLPLSPLFLAPSSSRPLTLSLLHSLSSCPLPSSIPLALAPSF
eukprot:scaffold135170_cov32-Tisochrysis_lutea.AAC.2